MKVLIVGGAGFIGGVTTRLFEEAGHNVTVLDNLSTGHRHNLKKAKLIVGDTLNPNHLQKLFGTARFDVVLDFAAKIQVEESTKLPKLYFENNSYGPLQLLDHCVRNRIKGFILSSTAAVYGLPKRVPVREGDPTLPINPYGWSKLVAEKMLASYEQSQGLNWLAFRYFNAAGAYAGIGPDYPFMTHLIPSAIAAQKAQKSLTIFGGDYKTKDGTCVRDYVHVEDVARAHVEAAERIVKGEKFNQPINLGSSKGYSVLEVINTVEKESGQPLPYKMKGRRAGDPATLIASNQLAKQLFGWQPKHNLKQIVQDALAWAI